ncbi:glutamate synthase domain-containing protein 1 [Methanohalophilus levihalophilus]|uniref:class II glutamine amidotransferase n=1 Tax=Methanohalophilus levihalophilus TaxID=1431282 RepID=UPI001AE6A7A4|nr:glutamine amidotransferase family protein [Methanohalophilus levihalophilus]MBP2030741.1 glutamate synthase domain-containing protein 1 [Methanohalophilus levihalophilus]
MCGIIGVIDRKMNKMDGSSIRDALSLMNERGSGEGAGYAAYGIYPDFADCYALHVFFDNLVEPKSTVDDMIQKWGRIVYQEEIPTYQQPGLKRAHVPWRYFFKPYSDLMTGSSTPEDDIVKHLVMHINSDIKGALVFSSGKNMGVFKAAGWPEDVANFYRIENYEGHIWIAHNRYPTNTPGWWGGAHPFNLLDWGVVHNGEITSYGTNRRFVESNGYTCSMFTDTEVVAYLFDLLGRHHKLPEEAIVKALAPPFWDEIDSMEDKEHELNKAIRLTYGPALMNGPFAIVVATQNWMVGFTDRIKLRPLVVGENGDRLYISSEEAAIRVMDPNVQKVYMPKAGEPVIGRVIE